MNTSLKWKNIYNLCIKTTSDVQLRWFQLRILHRILSTEKYLYTCRIVESPLCTFCRLENETIDHLFYKCDRVKHFWDALTRLIQNNCPHAYNFRFDEKLVLFGMSEGLVTDQGLDQIIMWAKYVIYKSKFQKTLPTVHIFVQFFKLKWNTEKFISVLENTQLKFNKIWLPYLSLLD